MKGELVKTITSDGLELKGFFSDQKRDIAVFHSHGTAGDFYTHEFVEVEGERLAKEKISFLTANNRGHDVYADIRKHKNGKIEWAQIGGGFEKFEDCLFDIEAWINFLVGRGVKKIILQGHSLGPQKILYYQSIKKDSRVVGQIYLSPCNDAGLALMKHGKKKYLEINKKILKNIKSNRKNDLLPQDLAIVCPMSSVTYSGYLIEEGVGVLNPYHSPQSKKWQKFKNIKEPLLIVLGEKDIYINGSCQENDLDYVVSLLKEKTKKVPSTIKVVKDGNHSYIGTELELVKIIKNWLKQIYQI
ncbi:MAG: hypothetical protein UR54_C0025G0007 [Candidatus Roizmanbacteria bacterium GW2011_GWA2_34_18]|uniref:Serine aminopeptidase S33 domain-containing protein n=1 Tax=Candidatus Roizmanbacteria bacterium GW2011_GWA2_34_18 TaxID=1618477 RepID=A0A0G0D8U3_9BACT|nr:MAG: hypothetical protein UR54_C0025G0007 [Candidatus Roizmanbacteria bacterium GW2011_GWA2_34_18]